MTEHYCEFDHDLDEACGKPARFKVDETWMYAEHYDELMAERKAVSEAINDYDELMERYDSRTIRGHALQPWRADLEDAEEAARFAARVTNLTGVRAEIAPFEQEN